jgi:hypothetical protein
VEASSAGWITMPQMHGSSAARQLGSSEAVQEPEVEGVFNAGVLFWSCLLLEIAFLLKSGKERFST